MEVRTDGKIALVTGATQGIGPAVAEALAGSGCAGFLLTGRNAARGAAVAEALTAGGVKTAFVAADLGDAATPERLVGACLERFGRIDLLVNAAADTNRSSLLDAGPQDWDRIFAVNARTPFFLMQGAVRAMRERGEGGAIVNILSMNSHCGTPELAVYSATKGALATLTRNTANAHHFDRIRVNGINVGWADTPAERVMQSQTLGLGEGWLDAASATQPFGRLISAREVADFAVFLLSDASGALIDHAQWVMGAP